MKKAFITLILGISTLAQSQTFPESTEILQTYVKSQNAYAAAARMWGNFKPSDCTNVLLNLKDQSDLQANINHKIIDYISGVPYSSISTMQKNYFRMSGSMLSGLNSLTTALMLRCKGDSGNDAELYYQISTLSIDMAQIYLDKLY